MVKNIGKILLILSMIERLVKAFINGFGRIALAEKFSTSDFIRRVARRLVAEFDDASIAGTPSLIGTAREHPARRQLENLLPGYLAVGSGLIVDSFGGVSKQQDIVIFERFLCPVYSINGAPEATYYPVEGVVAVGEVKSSLSTATLRDAFAKVHSAKSLRRYSIQENDELGPPSAPFRTYGNRFTLQDSQQEFDQTSRHSDQVFGFALFGTLSITQNAALAEAAALWRQNELNSPSIVATLSQGFMKRTKAGVLSDELGDAVAFLEGGDRGFGHLVERLVRHSQNGRTVPAKWFQRYLRDDPEKPNRYPVLSSQVI